MKDAKELHISKGHYPFLAPKEERVVQYPDGTREKWNPYSWYLFRYAHNFVIAHAVCTSREACEAALRLHTMVAS